MLIWMRDGTGAGVIKFVLMGLLLMAVVGLILMDRNDLLGGASGASNATVAKGGGVKINIVEFDRILRRTLSPQGMGPQEAYQMGLVDTVISSEIQGRLFTKASHKLGLEISDEMLTRQIAKLAEPLATEGRTKKEALQQILRTQGISESEFVLMIRQEMANTLLRAALQPPATLGSPLMAKTLYRYDNETRTADVIVFKNDSVTDLVKPTEEQLQKYYESNKADFLIPESRTVTIATLKADMLKKNVKISDEQIRAEYDKNIASYTRPPQRRVEQAVLKTEEEAKKALDSMKAGKPMKDSVPKDSYNGDQAYEQAGLLPEIATPVFTAKKGATLGPIQTALGWHVLLVKETIPETKIPFEQVKDKLRADLENTAVTDELYQAGNTIEDRAAAGDKLEAIVNDYGMTTDSIGPFRASGTDKDGKDLFKSYGTDKDKMIQTAFDFEQGEIAPIVETADGKFHVIRVDAVTPNAYRDYKTVKADLEKRWMDEQRRLTNRNRAKTALDSLNAGKSLAEVAKQDNQTVQSLKNINRKDQPAAPLTPMATMQIFAADKGKNFSAELDNGYIVGQVTGLSLPPDSVQAPEKDLKTLEELTGRTLAQDMLAQYMSSLTNGKEIKINKALLEQTYAAPQDQAP